MSDYDHSRSRTDSEVALRKIFIGGLSYGTDDEKLKNYFGVYGFVQDAVVMKDPVSRRSRGFGFITFSDISAVDNALAHEPHTIDARKVEAKRAVPRSEVSRDTGGSKVGTSVKPSASGSGPGTPGASGNSLASPSQTQIQNESRHAMDARINMDEYAYNKIFVGGLHYDTRDAEFRSYFERFGRVMSAEVMFNRETHKSRGFGFIVFELEKGAESTCAEKEHVIDGKVVEVKRAIPRSRIGSNGSILPPATQVRPSSQAVPPTPARPVETAAPTATGGGAGTGNSGGSKTHPAPVTAAAKVTAASASKVRQDMRRSASMGAPPTTAPVKSVRPGQQSLAASIAGIGVPSPRAKVGTATTNSVVISVPPVVSRVAAGSTYAAALRTGAVAEDSETSITDQMLIAGLQSDLLQAQSTSSSLYGGLFSDSHSHAPISVIERPPRSFSEPVIQLPQKMGSDYFKNQLSLIQGRGGVAALGGAFNPVSPLLTSFGSISPSQKAIRSPVMTALASPLLPLPPLGLAWLSTSPTKTSDASIIETPAPATTTAATDFFLPLPSTTSNMNTLLPEVPAGQQQQQQQQHQQQIQQQLLSRQQDFQHLQYMQQQFLQQQMQQMQQQQAYYQSQGLGLINQTLVNQQQMGIQLINGQTGLYTTQNAGQGAQNQVEGIPSPLAWASMVSVPQQVQGQQQYFEPLLQQGYQQGQGFYTTQQPMTQQQYFQQQQYHIQMQQHLQQSGQYSINSMGMVMPPSAVAFSSPLQSQQFMSVPYMPQNDVTQQTQVQVQTQATGTVRNGTSTSTTSAVGNSVGLGVVAGQGQAVAVGAIVSPGSGAVSRSGSLLQGSVASTPIGSHSENGSVSNGDVSASAAGVVDKDELFLYEGLRLDGDAPEFEPQAARGW